MMRQRDCGALPTRPSPELRATFAPRTAPAGLAAVRTTMWQLDCTTSHARVWPAVVCRLVTRLSYARRASTTCYVTALRSVLTRSCCRCSGSRRVRSLLHNHGSTMEAHSRSCGRLWCAFVRGVRTKQPLSVH
jgi:hypothetical protein